MIAFAKHCRIKSIAVSFCLLSMAGCASTPAEIRRPDRQFTFTVAESYQAAYQTALTHARSCYQMGGMMTDITVQGDLHPETRSAEIVIAWHRGAGADAQRLIDIQAIDDTHSKIIGTFASGPVDRMGQTLKGWFSGAPNAC
jgi:hypothetical protein